MALGEAEVALNSGCGSNLLDLQALQFKGLSCLGEFGKGRL